MSDNRKEPLRNTKVLLQREDIFEVIVLLSWKLSKEVALRTLVVTHLHTSSHSALTPESSAEDLGVESFLVFADFRSVANWACVGGIDIDHRSFPDLQFQLLKTRAQTYTHTQLLNY